MDREREVGEFLPVGALACGNCRTSLSAIERDLASLPSLRAETLARLEGAVGGPDGPARVERIRAVRYFPDPLESAHMVEDAVERLRNDLLALIDEGARIIVE